METLEPCKYDSKIKCKSRASIEISQPSVGFESSPVRSTANDVNSSVGYQHVMIFIHDLNETVS